MVNKKLSLALLLILALYIGGCSTSSNQPVEKEILRDLKTTDQSVSDVKLSEPDPASVSTEIEVKAGDSSASVGQLLEEALKNIQSKYPDRQIIITIKDDSGNPLAGGNYSPQNE